MTTMTTTSPTERAIHTILGTVVGFALGFGVVALLRVTSPIAMRLVGLGIPLLCGVLCYRYGSVIADVLDQAGFGSGDD